MDKILFSERLARRRKEMGYKTQRDFAKAYDTKFPTKKRDESNGSDSGILGTLKNYESGGDKCNPKLQIVVNMCSILDCSVDYLLGAINKPQHEQQFVCEYTGLSLESIETLHELSAKHEALQTVTYGLLNSLLDWFMLEGLAIYCEDYNKNKYLDQTLYVQDKQGNNIGMLYGGDTAYLLVQNKFKDFLDFMGRSSEDEVHKYSSRSAWRKEIGKTSISEIAEQLIEDAHKEKTAPGGNPGAV